MKPISFFLIMMTALPGWGASYVLNHSQVQIRALTTSPTHGHYLQSVGSFPKNTVFDIDEVFLGESSHYPYFSKGKYRNSNYGFVRGARIISAPGWSAEKIKAHNEKATSIFVSRKLLGLPRQSTPQGQDIALPKQSSPPPAIPKFYAEESVDPNLADHSSDDQTEIKACEGCRNKTEPTLPTSQNLQNVDRLIEELSNREILNSEDIHGQTIIQPGPPPAAVDAALGYLQANLNKKKCVGIQPCATVTNSQKIVIVDYTKPANKKRMYIYDVATGRSESYFATHGAGSSAEHTDRLSRFSNANATTVPGFQVTRETYWSDHLQQKALKLVGLEDHINQQAYTDGKVFHGVCKPSNIYFDPHNEYVGRRRHQYARSNGCPAVACSDKDKVLSALSNQGQTSTSGILWLHWTGQQTVAGTSAETRRAQN